MDAVKVIQTLVAPVVMISACGLLCLAFYNRLAIIISRIRAFHHERLTLQEKAEMPGAPESMMRRIGAIDQQLPEMMHRARLVRNLLVCLVLCITCMILCSLSLWMSLFREGWTIAATVIFIAGQCVMLCGMMMALLELRLSLTPVSLERDFVVVGASGWGMAGGTRCEGERAGADCVLPTTDYPAGVVEHVLMTQAQVQEPKLVRSGSGFRMQELGLVVVIVTLGVVLSVAGYYNAPEGQGNAFFNLHNLFNGVAMPMAIYAIMAVGLTLVIITGGIDISVGSIFAVTAMATAWSLQYMGLNAPAWKALPVAFAVPIAVGTLCGLVNGVLVVALRLHPFIVTLGTMSIFRGLANVVPPAKTLPTGGRDVPAAFTDHFMRWGFGADLYLLPMIIMLACVAGGWIFLSFMVAGRETYAVGGNEEAARFSGLRVGAIKVRVYAIAGMLAGVAGMVSVGRFGTANCDTGNGYELMVIAAAVVGGASLNGGRGTALGALFGALIIRLIVNGISIMQLNTEYTPIVVGAAIIVAAAIDQFSEATRARRASAGRVG